jgi:hypothetical protein
MAGNVKNKWLGHRMDDDTVIRHCAVRPYAKGLAKYEDGTVNIKKLYIPSGQFYSIMPIVKVSATRYLFP